jgi:predicted Zn-dependent peptidase
VVSERLEGARSVALGLWVDSGSRSEPLELGGISHFIEHLIFKGTESWSALDIARKLDEMGGELNAATSKEYTIVHGRFLDEHLEQAFELMAEMVSRPRLAEIDAEREVVLEEVAMYEDSPPELIHDYLSEAVFGDHPLGRPVIGHTSTLQALTLDSVVEYQRQHYVCPAMVIAAAGNVDHDQLCRLAEKYFEQASPAPAVPPVLSTPEPRHVAVFTQKETEQYHVCLGGPGPRRDDPDRFALSVIDAALGGAWSSRLFQEVREKRGLAYSVYSYTSLYAETGLAAIYFGSREEALEEAMSVILDELKIVARDLSADEIARNKNHLRGQLVLGMESSTSRMQLLGRSVMMGLEMLTVDDILHKLDAVTREDVADVAAKYYDTAEWSTTCIGANPQHFRAVTGGFDWEEA